MNHAMNDDDEIEEFTGEMDQDDYTEEQAYINDDGFDDEDFLEAQLEEQRLLNAKLRQLEATGPRESYYEQNSYPVQPTQSISRKSKKPIVSKQVVHGVARRSSPHLTQQEIDENRRIEQGNVHLLRKLQHIQHKGGQTANWQSQTSCKHEASASRNRKSHHQNIANQNSAFLKRLQSVKSTLPGSKKPPVIRRTPNSAPRVRQSKPKERPAWVDVPGCGF